MVTVHRLNGNPMIEASPQLGSIVNHPSLIEVPFWVEDPLGDYYLYFSHKYGNYIRLAYADDLEGPWKIYQPGTLHIQETPFIGHIASPDVHVDHDREVVRMYFHGQTRTRDLITSNDVNREYRNEYYGFSRTSLPYRFAYESGRRVFNNVYEMYSEQIRVDRTTHIESDNDPQSRSGTNVTSGGQITTSDEPKGLKNILRKHVPRFSAVQETRAMESVDGLTFETCSEVLGPSWMAVTSYEGCYYAMGRDGYVYVSTSPTEPFSRERKLFDDYRHFGVHVEDNHLHIYYSRPADQPEQILRTKVDLNSDIPEWQKSEPIPVIRPETEYEGVDISLRESNRRSPTEKRQEIRDPDVFYSGEKKYLAYAAGGESAIAIAQLDE